MRGRAPSWITRRSPMYGREPEEYEFACGTPHHWNTLPAFAAQGQARRPTEHINHVTCPNCLCLMREATDPVRYDFLRERGLVPELPLVSG